MVLSTLEPPLKREACQRLCEHLCDLIEDATRKGTTATANLQGCYTALDTFRGILDGPETALVNQHGAVNAPHPALRDQLQAVDHVATSTVACHRGMIFMMVAKLHAELEKTVEYGKLTKTFKDKLVLLCQHYGISFEPRTLVNYLRAGKLILRCPPLACVNVTKLLAWHDGIAQVLDEADLCGRIQDALNTGSREARLLLEGPPKATFKDLLGRICAACPDLEDVGLSDTLSAADFARFLQMDFGNDANFKERWAAMCANAPSAEAMIIQAVVAVESRRQGSVSCEIIQRADRLSEALLLRTTVGPIKAHAVVIEEPLALLLIVRDAAGTKGVAMCSAQPIDGVRECFPDVKPDNFVTINLADVSCPELSQLYMLSQFLRGNHSLPPVATTPACPDLFRMQIAFKVFTGALLVSEEEFLDAISEPGRAIEECKCRLDDAAVEALQRSGFVIVRNLIADVPHDRVRELRVLMEKDAAQAVSIFQGAHDENDGKRKQLALANTLELCGEDLKAFLRTVETAIADNVPPSRRPRGVNVLCSLPGCAPQRPHEDYLPRDLEFVPNDGVCGGLPLGVIVALEDGTKFDACPGAVGHALERFHEMVEAVLSAGDALFFLGNAVHGGAAFEHSNVRIHAYLDSDATADLRSPDTTYFADVAAGVVGALPRGVRVRRYVEGMAAVD